MDILLTGLIISLIIQGIAASYEHDRIIKEIKKNREEDVKFWKEFNKKIKELNQ